MNTHATQREHCPPARTGATVPTCAQCRRALGLTADTDKQQRQRKQNNMQNKVTIQFKDNDDRENFLRYIARARGKDGTVGGLYAGLLCSALKRCALVGEAQATTAQEAINEIGAKAGESLAEKATKLYDALTTDERQRFSQNGALLYRLAKLLIVTCQDDIERQWSAEGFKTELRALKRIRLHRYV